MISCKDIIESYIENMRSEIHCKPASGRIAFAVPFFYPDHDNIEMFVREFTDHVMVSDLGQTLRRLDTIGIDYLESGRTAFQVERIATGYDVEIHDGILCKKCTREDIGKTMSDVLSACMGIGDLAYGSRGYQPMTFKDEVFNVLRTHSFKPERNYEIKGRYGSKYHVDFNVREQTHVIYVQTLSSRTRHGCHNWVNKTYRMWSDIGTSQIAVKMASLISDESPVKPDDLKMLQSAAKVYRWRDRDQMMADFRGAA